MTRRRQREYLVATGFAAAGVLILALVILTAGSRVGSLATTEFSTSVLQTDAKPTGPTGRRARHAMPDVPATAGASQLPQPSADPDRQAFPQPAVPGDVTVQTSEAALSLPTETPGPAAGWTHNSQPPPLRNSTASTGRRLAPGAGGGLPPAFPIGGAAQASALTEDGERRAERDPTEASTQTARVSGARESSAAASTASSPTESSAATSGAASMTQTGAAAVAPSSPLAAPSASLPALLAELTEANPILGPIVVGGPEAFGGSALEDAFLDVFDEPVPLDVLVANAAADLMAPFELPGADSETLPVTVASIDGNRITNPEPATLLLLGTGLGLAARYARRRRPPFRIGI